MGHAAALDEGGGRGGRGDGRGRGGEDSRTSHHTRV
jgi:hypothetical protein